MNCRAIRHTLFVAGMVFVSSTFAGTDVIKCTDDAGHVTLTDQPCKGEDAAQVLVAAPAAPADAVAEVTRHQLANLPPSARLRAAPFTQVQAPGRALARDVATLKEARRTLMLLDGSMSASRQRGLAASR
ncbi:DUF4124 domain-containing protein [Massilia sp. RP-1-19]|uniref:DUF4124 domain-containing protein n=1 Tax=Massilia polaris TaxID=2728846 RepID=A0A848HJ51_9BURK|nr:DUF4124 domain-containing protein [Massilia polaris]NML60159.1 DUF4124 domain-containing protein [Massilia polaris]